MYAKDEILRNWAYNLRRIREKKGWSRYRLAQEAGLICDNPESKVNTRAVSQFENGRRGATFEILANIAQALNVSIDELLLKKPPPDFRLPIPKKRKKSGI